MKKIVTLLLSPTYYYADYRKSSSGRDERTKLIKDYNKRYLLVSLLLATAFGLTGPWNEYPTDGMKIPYILFISVIVWLIPLSRCNEIFYAFLKDAYDKVDHKDPLSDLTFGSRIRLALHSYLELVVNFSVIFYLIPTHWLSAPIKTIVDSLYFSGVTITTLGYGDIHPVNFFPKLLVVYEVFCGFILLIVSFAIYAGRGMNKEEA